MIYLQPKAKFILPQIFHFILLFEAILCLKESLRITSEI
jgi:hypothetical protein